MNIPKRSIAVAIILSIITCGIYSIYWFIMMTDEVAEISGDHSLSGVKALLLGIITCGIYYLYWSYKMGQALSAAKRNRGQYSDDKGLLFVILAVCQLSIVNYCIIQDELNQWSEA